ncbi:efflux RND transporter permease subunit [Marinigracilibium pacificum]|uniref:Efflux RND transporter permease subunit n=1 Tax=Marinigracilibium pacificum TaxID=2729599 RepID=A0A848IUT6_9BACT|nr:efflux RND transporter permease subunit [Marinigracilibium pacificum]NMM48263.1 efflux RND transporter permease subunit [Marinigracilibium pacificum]
MLNRIIKYFLENKLVTTLVFVFLIAWGVVTSPFNWNIDFLPTDPVPVDAIPDIGENQQIVFTNWPGRSPQDIEDQISYPLTTYLLGIPGVKSIRSSSIFGFSSIYIIFDEDIEFYWSRSRILEKLNSLPSGLLPENVQPSLGPDATALGQIFWYTIEGRDKNGNPTGGWDLQEIRTVQDFYVKYSLNSSEGVSEVASIGGYVKEYQIDVNPDALKAYNIPLVKVMKAVGNSNKDFGAKTVEINKAEYLVRGLGYIKSLDDLELAVVDVQNNVPIRVKDIARVSLGPAQRRGILDKDGAEVVGGVVVARYGSNPLAVINNVKAKIKEISPGLPTKTLADGTESQLTIVPFYDRSILIHETLGTLEEALSLEVLITILVVIVMILNLRASVLISVLLPIAVLIVFIAMRYFGVTANIVALSGIAIAIGTMVDLGVILSENIIKKIDEQKLNQPDTKADPGYFEKLKNAIFEGAAEVSSAILTAVSTTIVSFIPVFALQAAEGKLFRPLAWTKTFALIAALLVALFLLPTIANWVFGIRLKSKKSALVLNISLIIISLIALFSGIIWTGIALMVFGVLGILKSTILPTENNFKPSWVNVIYTNAELILSILIVIVLLGYYWLPLGAGVSLVINILFVSILVGLILGGFILLEKFYPYLLDICLNFKKAFLAIPLTLMILALNIWLGFNTVFGFIGYGFDKLGINIRTTTIWSSLSHTFPGIGEEFMPALDEGSFLLMPTSMPHSGIEYNKETLAQLDMLVTSIPEVELTVGKLGRVESALDPAPISMFENVINYKSEFLTNEDGRKIRYRTDKRGRYILNKKDKYGGELRFDKGESIFYDSKGEKLESNLQHSLSEVINDKPRNELIEDSNGEYFRVWRDHINSPDDIWQEIVKVTKIPGVTSAPKLQPIETRLVMLQTGMRAPMGIKVYGPDLKTIESFGMKLEEILKQVPSVKKEAVFADRIVGKPYLHFDIKRDEAARFGLTIEDIREALETSVGGMQVTTTVEGRERFPVRVRYPRELRNDPESLKKILLPTPTGVQIPLEQIADIEYVKGPQAIKSEETFLTGYVLFDRKSEFSEVEVVEEAKGAIDAAISSGRLNVPQGLSYKFSGTYENQIRAEKRLTIIVPIVLGLVFMILYFQFRSVTTSLMVFTGIAMAFSGGFILIWLYGVEGFGDINLFNINLKEIFQIHPINLSVAVWVGFIALFGIATDDGVLMATYLDQSFSRNKPDSIKSIQAAVVEAGKKRITPAIMTSATTIIALLPILTSSGRGSDIMIPMAIPAFGGMLVSSISYFIVPVIYCWREEKRYQNEKK